MSKRRRTNESGRTKADRRHCKDKAQSSWTAESVLNGLERLFQDLRLKPFNLRSFSTNVKEADWPDYFEDRVAIVEREYVLHLAAVDGRLRLVVDVERSVKDHDPNANMEFIDGDEIASVTRFLLTTDEAGLSVGDRDLQGCALATLLNFDAIDLTNYPRPDPDEQDNKQPVTLQKRSTA